MGREGTNQRIVVGTPEPFFIHLDQVEVCLIGHCRGGPCVLRLASSASSIRVRCSSPSWNCRILINWAFDRDSIATPSSSSSSPEIGVIGHILRRATQRSRRYHCAALAIPVFRPRVTSHPCAVAFLSASRFVLCNSLNAIKSPRDLSKTTRCLRRSAPGLSASCRPKAASAWKLSEDVNVSSKGEAISARSPAWIVTGSFQACDRFGAIGTRIAFHSFHDPFAAAPTTSAGVAIIAAASCVRRNGHRGRLCARLPK